MRQVSDALGEIKLINSSYTRTQYAFDYSWWSAFGFERNCDPKDLDIARSMAVTSNDQVNDSVGVKVDMFLQERRLYVRKENNHFIVCINS